MSTIRRKRPKKNQDAQFGTLFRLSQDEKQGGDCVVKAQFSSVQELSPEQDNAYKKARQWLSGTLNRSKPIFTIGGYAGTGKTTLLGALAADLCRDRKIAFCSFTGKAASVLEKSLSANGVSPAYCGTIHRLMYRPVIDPRGNVIGWATAEALDYDLIVVDEASMVSPAILEDMQGFGIPILAVGDHGQLPPVGEDSTNLLDDLDARLEQVRRQAMDNPVIALSVVIREGGDWRTFVKNSTDPKLVYLDQMEAVPYVMDEFKGFVDRPMSDDPLVLCATNRTRGLLNKAARSGLATEECLVESERVVCLKNAYLSGMLLANGFRGKVTSIGSARSMNQIKADVIFPDQDIELRQGIMVREQFGLETNIFQNNSQLNRPRVDGLLFDYGYALTVHKAQGSQAERVILYVERFGSADDFRRWLYTGVTRCTTSLVMAF